MPKPKLDQLIERDKKRQEALLEQLENLDTLIEALQTKKRAKQQRARAGMRRDAATRYETVGKILEAHGLLWVEDAEIERECKQWAVRRAIQGGQEGESEVAPLETEHGTSIV